MTMIRMRHVVGLIVVMLACSGAYGALAPAVKTAFDQFKAKFGTRWADGRTTPDDKYIISLTGAPPPFPGTTIGEMASLARNLTGDPNVVFTTHPFVSELGKVKRFTYPQVVDDRLVENAAMILQHSTDGGPVDILLNVAALPPTGVPVAVRDADAAVNLVRSIVSQELEDPPPALAYRLAQLDPRFFRVETELVAQEPHFLAFDRKLRLVFEVRARVAARVRCGFVPVLIRDYAIDAAVDSTEPGRAVVRILDLMQFAAIGKARVFDPNPINTLGLTQMPRSIDFNVQTSPHVEKRLPGLDDRAHPSYALSGTYASVEEIVCPDSNPEARESQDREPDFTEPRGGAQFAAANAYYHIDTMARWIADTLKIPQTVPQGLKVDVDSGKAAEPQAGYVRETPRHLWFGVTSLYDIYVAEDGDAVAHEYAHAVLDETTNGYFRPATRPVKGKDEARAINEGFGDYWAMSTFSAVTNNDLNCFMEWAKEGACLRRYDRLPYDDFDPDKFDHVNGRIWSSTLYDVFVALKNRELADGIFLMGHLQRAQLGDAPIFKQMAEGIVIADAQRAGGANKETLCRIFEDRFGPLTCCQKIGCKENWKP